MNYSIMHKDEIIALEEENFNSSLLEEYIRKKLS